MDDQAPKNETAARAKTLPSHRGEKWPRQTVSQSLPATGFPLGLFVEIVVSEDDPQLPGVTLVNAHEQRS